MVQRLQAVTEQGDEMLQFVGRVLEDFGLLEEFDGRPERERVACLRWIAASPDSFERNDRMCCLLDALAARDPLLPA